jgi:hypothetical protein
MMPIAKQWNTAESQPDSYGVYLGKLLVIGIILTPLVMMLFPELNYRSGSLFHGKQDAATMQSPISPPVLIPDPFSRNRK